MELRTNRLLLRSFQPEDVAAFATFVADPAYGRYLGPVHPDAARFVDHNITVDQAREPSWVIVFEHRIVGSIFLGMQPDDRIAELACLLAPEAWGKGIAREAGRAVIAHAFTQLGIEKIFARAEAANVASRRAMEKSGMKQEGLLRQHRLSAAGERADEVIYGLVRTEWTP